MKNLRGILLLLVFAVPLARAASIEFEFRGNNYRTVESNHTNKIWLDRNLGATQSATQSDDSSSYGDLYQFGRAADGHQLRNSSVTTERALSITPNHNRFIADTPYPHDWVYTEGNGGVDRFGNARSTGWQDGGVNDICPAGFAVPTKEELRAETLTVDANFNLAAGFSSFLRLPANGTRGGRNSGVISNADTEIGLWTRSREGNSGHRFYANDNGRGLDDSSNQLWRSHGFGVRCIYAGDSISEDDILRLYSALTVSENSQAIGEDIEVILQPKNIAGDITKNDLNVRFVFSDNVQTSSEVRLKNGAYRQLINKNSSGEVIISALINGKPISTGTQRIVFYENFAPQTFNFDSKEYQTVRSPDTYRIWLDRNLGATKVADSATDAASYGDLYQWGRAKDGHQARDASTTTSQASTIKPNHNKFIKDSNDWSTFDNFGVLREAAWGDDGTNSICPPGFQVPTRKQLAADTTLATTNQVTNVATAASGFLKIPASGFHRTNGADGDFGVQSTLWAADGQAMFLGSSSRYIGGTDSAHGLAVRCILAGDTGSASIGEVDILRINSTISANKTNNIATITLQAKNLAGNLTAGGRQDIVFSTTAGNLQGSVLDVGDGTYSQELQGSSGLSAVLSATIAGKKIATTVAVNFAFTGGTIIFDSKIYRATLSTNNTNKIWLDRNIGADAVASSYNQTNSYGSYFNFDNAQTACPAGFRTPNRTEIEKEVVGVSNKNKAVSSFLHLPAAGYIFSGTSNNQGNEGLYWTNASLDTEGITLSFTGNIRAIASLFLKTRRHSVRCIYGGGAVSNVLATIVSIDAVTIRENSSNFYTIRLGTKPTGDVTITPQSQNTAATVSGAIAFSATNWNTAQTISITAVEDANTSNEVAIITHTISGGGYAGVVVNNVIANTVDDNAGYIIFNDLVYRSRVSPDTNRTWLDRNLGATRVATSTTDRAGFGDLYQWGRGADGHQLRTSSVSTTKIPLTATSSNFISGGNDWTDADNDGSFRSQNWDICPPGFTVPTREDLANSRFHFSANWSQFNRDLRLTFGGSRNKDSGSLDHVDVLMTYWSKTVKDDNKSESFELATTSEGGSVRLTQYRARGLSIRCINSLKGVITPDTIDIIEGNSKTYTIRLISKPSNTNTVTITPAANNSATLKISPSTISFSATDWDTPQTITLNALADTNDIRDSTSISHSGSGDGYDLLSLSSIAVSIIDNAASVSISTATISINEGDSATYTAVLDYQPTEEVTITPVSNNPLLSANSLTFTIANWNTPQIINISTIRDDKFDNQIITISHSVASGDFYNGIAVATIEVNITDTTADFVYLAGLEYRKIPSPNTDRTWLDRNLGATTATGVASYGDLYQWGRGNDGHQARDNTRTSTTIRVDISGGNNEFIVGWPDWVFGSPTLRVEAWKDGRDNDICPSGFQVPTIGEWVAETNKNFLNLPSAGYRDRDTANVDLEEIGGSYWANSFSGSNNGDSWNVINEKSSSERAVGQSIRCINSLKSITTTPTRITIVEGQSTAYTVHLASQPSGSNTVTVILSANNSATLKVSPSTISFNSTDWNTPQTITLNALADTNDIRDSTSISHSGSGDGYESLSLSSVAVSIIDNAASVSLSTATISINEGASATYTVVLDYQPTVDVVITPASNNNLLALSGSLTFTVANWDTPQTITISTSRDDKLDDPTIISHSVASADFYNGIAVATIEVDITVKVTDNDINNPPNKLITIADISLNVGDTTTTYIVGNFQDTDTLTYTVQTDSSTVTVTGSQTITITAKQAGSATITVTATDTINQTIVQTFTVTVTTPPITPPTTPPIPTIIVSAVSSSTVIAGETVNYSVQLAAQPSSDTTITASLTYTIVGASVTPAALTFTDSDWNTSQTITITAALNIAGTPTITVRHTVIGYDTIVVASRTVTVKKSYKFNIITSNAYNEKPDKIDTSAVLRYLFGSRGTNIIGGNSNTTANEATATAIENLQNITGNPLNIDGIGNKADTKDATLILRYQLGTRCNALTTGLADINNCPTILRNIENLLRP